VRIVPRSAALAVAAAVDDTELEVDAAGDFYEDGGTLDLNGAQLAYTGITWGSTEDDTDTILLAAPLTDAADVDDPVIPVVGGQPAQDWYGIVDMREGDPVHVPIRFSQRLSFTPGVYDSPPPVVVSEDLSRIEDMPGQIPSTAIQFYEDTFTVTETGDQTFTLTYLPIDRSEHLYWQPGGMAGTYQQEGDLWAVDGLVITIPDIGIPFALGDRVTVEYAYLVGGPTGVVNPGDPEPPPDPDPDPDATVIVPTNEVTLTAYYTWGGTVIGSAPQWGDDDTGTLAQMNVHYGAAINAKRQSGQTVVDAQPSLVVDSSARIALWTKVEANDHPYGVTLTLRSSPLSDTQLYGELGEDGGLAAPADYVVTEMLPHPGVTVGDFLTEWVSQTETVLISPNWPVPSHPPGSITTGVVISEVRVAIYYP